MAALFPSLLGAQAFAALPAAVRAVHGGESREWCGHSVIRRGSGVLSRICAFMALLPKAGVDIPTRVRIDASASGEVWRRQFGSSAMPSRLSAEAGLLREQLGAVRFYFSLSPESDGFHWQVQKVRVAGIPLPARWFKGVQARSYANQQGYAFSVQASLPIVGLIIRYDGHLQ